MVNPQLIVHTEVSPTYELKKKLQRCLRVNLLGTGSRLLKKVI